MSYDQNAVDSMFQQHLGRAGTGAEHSFLQKYVDAGQLDPMQIGQYLQGTPEALASRLGKQQGQYQGLLTQNNNQILGQAADAANSSFAQNGRQFSSGQGNAVLQAGQQLASQQSPMIANFYGQGQQGLNDQYSQVGQGALQRAYNLQDQQTQWAREDSNYNRQQNDFNNYLKGQQTRNMQSGLMNAGLKLGGNLITGGALFAMGG